MLFSSLQFCVSLLFQIRLWLFCFQKSVALVLSKLLLSSSKSYPDTKQAIAQYRNSHDRISKNVRHNDPDIFARCRAGSVDNVNTAPPTSASISVSVSSWKESEKVEVMSRNLNNNTTSSSSSDTENYRGTQYIRAIS